jgi:hypothetical protein
MTEAMVSTICNAFVAVGVAWAIAYVVRGFLS